MKLHTLSDEFDNGEINHFTHYDYMLQVVHNGQPSALRDHVKQMRVASLIKFIDRTELSEVYRNIIRDEIIKRAGEA